MTVADSEYDRRGRHPASGIRRDLAAEIDEACRNEETVNSLRGRTHFLNQLRDDSRRDHADFSTWRDRARSIKETAIDRLPELIQSVRNALRERGGRVYLASDAEDANRYIAELGRRRDAASAVKSKSMTTEEIELNEALEAAGLDVVETDLGEFVAQLAEERPSHIIGPVIHKSEREIVEVFREHVDRDLPEDVSADELTRLAREVLRERFLNADMGITGANFVVAETGSIALVTNEGNARWTMEAPPLHVAVAGVEKLIPTMEDLQPFYELLPKSGTGQPVTSYFSLVTPPVQDAPIDYRTGEAGTTREFHLVLIDNGRRGMARDPALREALYCIRCGACLNACANYQVVGGHVYGGETYAGGIGNAWEAGVTGRDEADAFNDLCTGCSQCKPACPVKIDIPWMNTVIRDRLNRDLERSDVEGFVFEQLIPDETDAPSVQKRFFAGFEAWVPLLAWLAPLFNRVTEWPVIRWLLQALIGVAADRPLPRIAVRPFTDRWTGADGADEADRETVVLLADPYSNYLHPERLESAAEVLAASGLRVQVVDPGATGRDALSQGMIERAREQARGVYETLVPELDRDRAIVVLEPSIAALFRDEYGRLLESSRHERLRNGTVEIGEIACELYEENRLQGSLEGRSFFLHGHCQQRAADQFTATPRLMEAMGGDVEVSRVECCGMAGSFGYKKQFYGLAMKVGEPLFDAVNEDPDREILATGTSCTAQIRDGTGTRPRHPIELVREAVEIPRTSDSPGEGS